MQCECAAGFSGKADVMYAFGQHCLFSTSFFENVFFFIGALEIIAFAVAILCYCSVRSTFCSPAQRKKTSHRYFALGWLIVIVRLPFAVVMIVLRQIPDHSHYLSTDPLFSTMHCFSCGLFWVSQASCALGYIASADSISDSINKGGGMTDVKMFRQVSMLTIVMVSLQVSTLIMSLFDFNTDVRKVLVCCIGISFGFVSYTAFGIKQVVACSIVRVQKLVQKDLVRTKILNVFSLANSLAMMFCSSACFCLFLYCTVCVGSDVVLWLTLPYAMLVVYAVQPVSLIIFGFMFWLSHSNVLLKRYANLKSTESEKSSLVHHTCTVSSSDDMYPDRKPMRMQLRVYQTIQFLASQRSERCRLISENNLYRNYLETNYL